MTVGDINSTEKGSGARFNTGKPDMSLIPLEILAGSYVYSWENSSDLDKAVGLVGVFQMGGESLYLYEALDHLKDHFPDCAKVFEYGKKKYAAWNWAKGMAWSIPIACIGRHYLAIKNGQEIDEESGHSHIGHILCNIVMLCWYFEHYEEGDDRFKGVE